MNLVHYLLELSGTSASAVELGAACTSESLGSTLLAEGREGPSREGRLGPGIEEPLRMLLVATRGCHPTDASLGREILYLQRLRRLQDVIPDFG